MEIAIKAVAEAKARKREDDELRLCLNYLVCPKCGKDLETATFPSYKYSCPHCEFGFSAVQEASLIQREEMLKK